MDIYQRKIAKWILHPFNIYIYKGDKFTDATAVKNSSAGAPALKICQGKQQWMPWGLLQLLSRQNEDYFFWGTQSKFSCGLTITKQCARAPRWTQTRDMMSINSQPQLCTSCCRQSWGGSCAHLRRGGNDDKTYTEAPLLECLRPAIGKVSSLDGQLAQFI